MPLPTGIIDLRSDTTTFPLPEMLASMVKAPLGDDVYGNDPTVNRLQEMAAEMTGQDAALLVASGTMGNLVALLTHCSRGSEVILGKKAHIFVDEVGGMAALGGIQACTVPNQADGTLRLDEVEESIRPEDVHAPRTRLICIENTQNICGGIPLTVSYTRQMAELAHRNGLKLHIDGARLFNAAVAQNVTVRDLAEPADSVMFCLSKGLCAPVGSMLCGSKEFIQEARRYRKQVGGGMRQAGVLAAAGLVALQKMPDLLQEDHRRAVRMAERLAQIPGVKLTYGLPRTNMVYIELSADLKRSAEEITVRMAARNIWLMSEQPRQFRLVTHYWVEDEDVERVVSAFRDELAAGPTV
jgi:threonine aldolase